MMLLASGDAARSKRRAGIQNCGARGANVTSNQVGISIVNGNDAKDGVWRWQVGISDAPGERPWCGGMLISPEWVLTAAHCLRFKTTLNVVAGEWATTHTSGKEQNRWVSNVITHPEFNMPTQDFGLLKLETPVELGDGVGTVCLPDDEDVAPGSACWITGWGHLEQGDRVGSTILQEAQVTILSNADCQTNFGYRPEEIDGTMVCAQGRTSDGNIVDACQGDSGGPLVCESDGRWNVYGATSWGRGCAGAQFPGVWARVHTAVPWINDMMAGNFPTPAPTPPPATTPAPPPTPPGMCPAHMSSGPDSKDDCKCNYGLICYEMGAIKCTNAYTTSHGFRSSRYFLKSCTDCECH